MFEKELTALKETHDALLGREVWIITPERLLNKAGRIIKRPTRLTVCRGRICEVQISDNTYFSQDFYPRVEVSVDAQCPIEKNGIMAVTNELVTHILFGIECFETRKQAEEGLAILQSLNDHDRHIMESQQLLV